MRRGSQQLTPIGSNKVPKKMASKQPKGKEIIESNGTE